MPALGLKIKTGFAIAILLEGEGDTLRATRREVVALSTSEVPDSQQPYHPALDLPATSGAAVTRRATAAVRKTARREMAALLKSLPTLRRAGLVVGSVIDPSQIANPHIRAHALEGKLFRQVVAAELSRHGVAHVVLIERDAYTQAAREMHVDAGELREKIDTLGKGHIRPWRSEEKLAALAAWCQL